MSPKAFTVRSNDGIMSVLATDVNIYISGELVCMLISAIWDTGATSCAITKKVVNDLGLVATGISEVHTANGIVCQNTYTIDVGLPNGVIVSGIAATEVDALTDSVDALIGMDVITLGDFSITNHNGITCMSFRIPSSHEIDYLKSPFFGIIKVNTPEN